ncbi:hypothetical protein ALC56_10342 [Trachymyrmex septentrionalis]|uniref:Uncharacterized protein n=1 Tax=Trachymyrmex septentrionalis TaxID=34720 RepID=A0A195F3Y3_9HYME|nr:hypothetical protein ALC56_10342 [Trachymyrmex septentrionalis]
MCSCEARLYLHKINFTLTKLAANGYILRYATRYYGFTVVSYNVRGDKLPRDHYPIKAGVRNDDISRIVSLNRSISETRTYATIDGDIAAHRIEDKRSENGGPFSIPKVAPIDNVCVQNARLANAFLAFENLCVHELACCHCRGVHKSFVEKIPSALCPIQLLSRVLTRWRADSQSNQFGTESKVGGCGLGWCVSSLTLMPLEWNGKCFFGGGGEKAYCYTKFTRRYVEFVMFQINCI